MAHRDLEGDQEEANRYFKKQQLKHSNIFTNIKQPNPNYSHNSNLASSFKKVSTHQQNFRQTDSIGIIN